MVPRKPQVLARWLVDAVLQPSHSVGIIAFADVPLIDAPSGLRDSFQHPDGDVPVARRDVLWAALFGVGVFGSVLSAFYRNGIAPNKIDLYHDARSLRSEFVDLQRRSLTQADGAVRRHFEDARRAGELPARYRPIVRRFEGVAKRRETSGHTKEQFGVFVADRLLRSTDELRALDDAGVVHEHDFSADVTRFLSGLRRDSGTRA